MPSIYWGNTFITGIPLLDAQNKHLVERLDSFFEHQCNERNEDFDCLMFQEFLFYIQDHFRQEELFYERYDPQDLDEHRQQHIFFQENLNGFIPDVINEGSEASRGLFEYIRDWVVFHILHLDKNIACTIKNSISV